MERSYLHVISFYNSFAGFLLSADFFSKSTFLKILLEIPSVLMSNSLYQDQARCFVGPDLGPKLFAKIFSRRQEQTE